MCVVLPSRERTSVATVSSASLRQELLEEALGGQPLEELLVARPVRLVDHLGDHERVVRAGSSRSRMPSASAIRIPPDDGGGFVSTSRPR